MRDPLDRYVPEDVRDFHPRPPVVDLFRWLQLALTAALLVMFINQLSQLQDANRRIARLYERMDALDQTRMLGDSPALSAQQALILKRLQSLENVLRERELEQMGSSDSSGSNDPPAALQAPPRP